MRTRDHKRIDAACKQIREICDSGLFVLNGYARAELNQALKLFGFKLSKLPENIDYGDRVQRKARANADGTATVTLGNGAVVTIDVEDIDLINQFSWNMVGGGYPSAYLPIKDGKRSKIMLHRLLLNVPPNMCVDHIDGDKLNNRRRNLRLATRSQNSYNRKPIRPLKGIYCHRPGRWQAKITVDKKRINLGMFATAQEAYKAYCVAAKKFHGEFARVK